MKSIGTQHITNLILFLTFPFLLTGQGDTSLYSHYLSKSHQFKNTNLDSALFYSELASSSAFLQKDSSKMAESIHYVAHLLKNKGDYNSALTKCFEALKIYDKINNYDGAIKARALIGTCYSLSHKNELAKEYFLSAIEIGEEHNLIQTAPYQGLGNVLYYQDSIEKAEKIYLQVIDLLQETGETSANMTAGIFTNLGNIKFMQDDLEAAKSFYNEAYLLYDKIGVTMGICITAYNIGEVYYKLEDYGQAEKYFIITLEKGKSINSIDDIQYALQSLSDTYKSQGLFKKALGYSEQYHTFKDSVNKANHIEEIDELNLMYNKEKNESILKKQGKQIRKAKIENIKRDQINRSLILGIIAAIVIAVIAFFSFLKIKKKNLIIEESKVEIDKSLKEKEILLKEIHHRVKNNLQMISSLLNLQKHSLSNGDAINALEESKNRVQAIALVHQKLYQDSNISEVNLHDYIHDLSQLMGQFSTSENNISYDLDISDITLNVDTSVPLGLIICELISNSQKHAFENVDGAKISIKVSQNKDGSFQLEYQDNGKGLPDNFSIENLNSLGFEIIHSLSQQLEGDITIGTKYGMFILLNFNII